MRVRRIKQVLRPFDINKYINVPDKKTQKLGKTSIYDADTLYSLYNEGKGVYCHILSPQPQENKHADTYTNLNRLLKSRLIRGGARYKGESFKVSEPWVNGSDGIIYLSDGQDHKVENYNTPRNLPLDKCRLTVKIISSEIVKLEDNLWYCEMNLEVIENEKNRSKK